MSERPCSLTLVFALLVAVECILATAAAPGHAPAPVHAPLAAAKGIQSAQFQADSSESKQQRTLKATGVSRAL